MANPPRIRNYQDLRYKFMRGLIRHEHQQRRHQFLKQAAEWTAKAIVSLSLASEPIRSAKQATQLEGVGAIIRSRLDKIQAENNVKADPPNPGEHVSTGSGLLVALLNESEALGSSEGGKPLVPEPDLKDACELICQEKFNKIQISTDGTPVLCPAWWRINVLISRGYVKKRTRGKQAVYELLPEGEQIARRLRGNHPPPIRIRSAPPLPQSPATKGRKKTPSKKKATESSSGNPCVTEPPTVASSTSNFKGPLYSHDRGTDGVLMLVDDHELGGDRVRLGEMCRRLKEWDIQYKTTQLPCGDYLWLWRENGKEVVLPIIVERKRADDLAKSIKDGRYLSQKDRMRQWREEFGMLSNEVSLQYVVESTPEAYRVKCMDGCNGVGKCGNPTVQQVEVAIRELENNKDFTLIKTKNLEITVEYLASITAELQQRVTNGDFQALRLMNQDRPLPLTDMRSKSTASKRSRVTATSTKTIADSSTTAHAQTNTFSSTYQTAHAQKVDSKTRDYEWTAHAQAQIQHTASSSGSSSLQNAGNKRHSSYIAIDVDDILEEVPKKSKKVVSVDLLDDSQEDYLYDKSPFDDSSSKPGSSRNVNSVRKSSPYMENSSRKYSPPINPTNQVKVKPDNDEEAKIVSIRDVIPDASLDAILSALCSSGGNIELAVAKLLDNPGNHDRDDRF